MAERKATAEFAATTGFAAEAHLERRVTPRDRIYEASADYDARIREYEQATGKNANEAAVLRARLDVEIAKDQLANIFSLRNATDILIGSSHRLERLTRWLVRLTVALFLLTIVLAGLTAYDVVRRLMGN
jgi:hypothetical protein